MNTNPSSDETHPRRVIHGLVAELASIDPGSDDYERKLAVLGGLIAQSAAKEAQPGAFDRGETPAVAANRSTWRARWLKQKARLVHSGRALLRTMRQAVSGERTSSGGDARPKLDRHAAFAAAGVDAQSKPDRPEALPTGRFTEGRFGQESKRRYMLYVPGSSAAGPAPLLVLLHGCQQSAADFAAGTRMNEAAEDAGVVVLYPEQSVAANLLRCWNWYALQDRSYGEGEAALIAAMTRHVISEHDIDPARVYVAGMSAGGGMAAVLARDYPKLYAALGVHSGVPAGIAHDALSAMRLMSSGPAKTEVDALLSSGDGHPVASIVFHGDEDVVVHPSNGQAIHAAPGTAQSQQAGTLQATTDPSAGQRGFTRSVEFGPVGVTNRELWIVHGAGHKWAGGSEAERHTDANGPNASREMLRFFLQHQRAG